MQKTEIKRHGAARKTILKGINEIYDTVRLTLGPEGGNVLLHRSFNRGSRITNDGVTIAECIEPKDNFINLVTTTFKEASKKTGQRVGDGTTSTIVIAGKLINDAFAKIPTEEKSEIQIWGMEKGGIGTIALKKHILNTISLIKEEIKKVTKKVKTQEELESIADVSLNGNREIAKIIAEMIWKIGTEGFISLTDGFTGKIETEEIPGARFPMKIPAPRFMNNPAKYEMIAEDCPVLITNYKIDSISDFASFYNNIKQNKLIIFAPGFSDEVLIQMIKLISPRQLPDGNITPSGLQIFPVSCPSLGSEENTPQNFHDLAAFCDASFINKNTGKKLKEVKEYDLGFLEKLTVKSTEDREDAVLIGGRGEKSDVIKERIKILKDQKEKTKMPEHKALIDKRIASLSSAGGLIKVGAPTDAEALYLKHKIEDAIYATQAALRFGYVEGGGLCLKKIAENLFEKDLLIKDALSAPYNQIQENYGGELKVDKNIIDPAKVVELEVEHAFGVAANLITCKAIIPEFDERDPKEGYQLIADAIMLYAKIWAKREGLLQDGLSEADAERLQKQSLLMDKEND